MPVGMRQPAVPPLGLHSRVSPRGAPGGMALRGSARDSARGTGPTDAAELERKKKWWRDYQTFVNTRDIRRLHGEVPLVSPRKLAPIKMNENPYGAEQREQEMWTRILTRREAMDAARQREETMRLAELQKQLADRQRLKAQTAARPSMPHGVTKEIVEAAAKHIQLKWEDKFKTLQVLLKGLPADILRRSNLPCFSVHLLLSYPFVLLPLRSVAFFSSTWTVRATSPRRNSWPVSSPSTSKWRFTTASSTLCSA